MGNERATTIELQPGSDTGSSLTTLFQFFMFFPFWKYWISDEGLVIPTTWLSFSNTATQPGWHITVAGRRVGGNETDTSSYVYHSLLTITQSKIVPAGRINRDLPRISDSLLGEPPGRRKRPFWSIAAKKQRHNWEQYDSDA